ncbi:ribonuclease HII [Indiicoccus explosivorum]|uniref:ribonuclease HII n=1 Tax=Indiicoccus explosivorum TaxID=1917864 RepID=UPI000B446FA2|nr:ribonuclease HII [Indiicoccus explosivorum]
MATTNELKQQLQKTDQWEAWMEALRTDSRKSVRSLLEQWEKKAKLRAAAVRAHEDKLRFDRSYITAGGHAAGTDEAGRGPLAGPLVTAAVILPAECAGLIGLTDSKQLTKKQRSSFESLIKACAISYSVHVTTPARIDEINIYEATKQSMTASIEGLDIQPEVVLADAMQLPVSMRCESIVKGDAKSLAIAAASVLAKTARDRLMEEYAVQFPAYHFERNAGYGTQDHLDAIRLHGITPIHRKTFEPVKSMMTGAVGHEHRD